MKIRWCIAALLLTGFAAAGDESRLREIAALDELAAALGSEGGEESLLLLAQAASRPCRSGELAEAELQRAALDEAQLARLQEFFVSEFERTGNFRCANLALHTAMRRKRPESAPDRLFALVSELASGKNGRTLDAASRFKLLTWQCEVAEDVPGFDRHADLRLEFLAPASPRSPEWGRAVNSVLQLGQLLEYRDAVNGRDGAASLRVSEAGLKAAAAALEGGSREVLEAIFQGYAARKDRENLRKLFSVLLEQDSPAALDAACELGDPAMLESALERQPSDPGTAAFWRFRCHLAAGDLVQAEKAAAQLASPAGRLLAQVVILQQRRAYAELISLLDDDALATAGLPAANDLIAAAAAGNDPAAFKRGEEFLRRTGAADNPETANDLAYCGLLLGMDTAWCRACLKRALAAFVPQAATLDTAAWLEFRSGNAQAAEPLIRRALLLVKPGQGAAVICCHAGEILLVLGRKAQAAELFRKALRFADGEAELDLAAIQKRLEELP